MEKYFNYGFNEETWRHHSRDVLNLSRTLSHVPELQNAQIRATTNSFKKNSFLNFILPHQFGGFNDPCQPRTVNVSTLVEQPPEEEGGSPKIITKTEAIDIPSMDHVNLYKDDIDLPQIRPRTLINRNEFYITIEKAPEFAEGISREEARKAIGKSVYTDWMENQGAALRKQLAEKEAILKEKKEELTDLRRDSRSHQTRIRRQGQGGFDVGPKDGEE